MLGATARAKRSKQSRLPPMLTCSEICSKRSWGEFQHKKNEKPEFTWDTFRNFNRNAEHKHSICKSASATTDILHPTCLTSHAFFVFLSSCPCNGDGAMYQWVCNQVLVHLRQVHLLFRTNVLALLVTATACPIGVLPRLAQTALRSVHVRPALTPHPTSLSSLINVCSIESQLVGEISISHRLQTTNSFSCCIGWVGAGVQGPSDGGLEFSRAHQGRNVWHHDEGSCDLNLVTSLASLRSLISHNDIHGLRHGTCRHFILIFLQSHTLPVAPTSWTTLCQELPIGRVATVFGRAPGWCGDLELLRHSTDFTLAFIALPGCNQQLRLDVSGAGDRAADGHKPSGTKHAALFAHWKANKC